MALPQAFPQLAAPLVSLASGQITQPWMQLLISLWNRTGGSSGTNTDGSSPGDLKGFAGQTPPANWKICDGSAISRAQYLPLFQAIGTSWGAGDGVNTFNIPDFRNRVMIGAGGTYAVGQVLGSASVSLVTSNLPSHNHAVSDPGHTHTFTASPHTHSINDTGHVHTSFVAAANVTTGSASGGVTAGNTGSAVTGVTINNTTVSGTNASALTGITTQNTGSAVPVSIIQPSAAAYIIIRT